MATQIAAARLATRSAWSYAAVAAWRCVTAVDNVRRESDVATISDDKLFTVIRGGEIFAPASLGRQEILISGERILAIGEGFVDKTTTLGGARVIDATGRKIVPGFIDQHLHFLGGGDFEGPLGRVPELHVSWITEGGVTTAVGIMGID